MPEDMFGYNLQIGDIVLTKTIESGYGGKGNLIPAEVIHTESGKVNIRVRERTDLLSDFGKAALTKVVKGEYLVKSTKCAILLHISIKNNEENENNE